MQVQDASRADILELVDFARANPWQMQHPLTLIHRFLTEFISDRRLIFDIHDEVGRTAVAVLLDKVNNPGNDACLEILGLREGVSPSQLLPLFFDLAAERTPIQRAGFQVGLPDEQGIADLARKAGLTEYYESYEMDHDLKDVKPDAVAEIELSHPNDADEMFEVLCKSHVTNPETSIPERESWKPKQVNSDQKRIFVWRSAERILGFASLFKEEQGSFEVHTIGVLPEARGLGIGTKLLNRCLAEAISMGGSRCHLTVAVENQRALGIYQRAGFQVVAKFKCYRKNVTQ